MMKLYNFTAQGTRCHKTFQLSSWRGHYQGQTQCGSLKGDGKGFIFQTCKIFQDHIETCKPEEAEWTGAGPGSSKAGSKQGREKSPRQNTLSSTQLKISGVSKSYNKLQSKKKSSSGSDSAKSKMPETGSENATSDQARLHMLLAISQSQKNVSVLDTKLDGCPFLAFNALKLHAQFGDLRNLFCQKIKKSSIKCVSRVNGVVI